jgi:hypothetical protein
MYNQRSINWFFIHRFAYDCTCVGTWDETSRSWNHHEENGNWVNVIVWHSPLHPGKRVHSIRICVCGRLCVVFLYVFSHMRGEDTERGSLANRIVQRRIWVDFGYTHRSGKWVKLLIFLEFWWDLGTESYKGRLVYMYIHTYIHTYIVMYSLALSWVMDGMVQYS